MSESNSKGLGDRIAKLTKATGIDKLVHSVVEDCGCEERQKKLNALFPGRKVMMSDEDARLWEGLKEARNRGKLNRQEGKTMYQIFNRTFNANEKPCSCTGKNRQMVEKLERAYEFSCR